MQIELTNLFTVSGLPRAGRFEALEQALERGEMTVSSGSVEEEKLAEMAR